MDAAWVVLTWLFLGGGSGFLLIGGLGIVRLPDVFTRIHAAGISDTMGAGLVLLGLCIHGAVEGQIAATLRLVLVLGFLWFTSPIATHSTAKAALSGGARPYVVGGKRPGEGESP